jgi:hypothetical protein
MLFLKRFILLFPFLVAATLNLFTAGADIAHLPTQRLTGCGFLFALPWSWLIDRIAFLPRSHSYTLRAALGYIFILWIPAALYAFSLWLLFFLVAKLHAPRQ